MTNLLLKRTFQIFSCTLLIVFIFTLESEAKMRMWPLTEIVRLSEYICIAKVQKITERKEMGQYFVLANELELVENLKGSWPPDKTITVYTEKDREDEPVFPPPGTNVILFLSKDASTDRLQTVFRFQGLWESYTDKRTTKQHAQSLEELREIIEYQSESGEIPAPKNTIWNYEEGTANKLWNQGRTLFEQKQYSEALNIFKESVKYWPTIERLKYIKSLEDGTNKTHAQRLRDEGYSLQKKENLKGAAEKYRESLKFWPDKQLEKHISLLDTISQGKYVADRVYNITPCSMIDPGQVTVPEDFVITYVTGPLHADWGGKSVIEVVASGDVTFTKEQVKKRFSTPEEETIYKHIPSARVKKIYSYVTSCGFFDLRKEYRDEDVRDGVSEYLEVTAGGKTHSVTVYYYHVERLKAIVSALEEVTRKAENKMPVSAAEAEEMVWKLPEVKNRADQIRKVGVKPFTKIESHPEKNGKPGTPQSVYTIYFGEDMGTHTNRVWTFLVDRHTRKISVYDAVLDGTISLEEWRKSNTN